MTCLSRTPHDRRSSRRPRLSLLVLAGLVLPAAAARAADDANSITFAAYGTAIKGDRAAFAARQDQPARFVGGIEDFRMEKWLDGGMLLSVQGHAMIRAEDYRLVIDYSKPDDYGFALGYEQFRTWTNASTVAFPGSSYWANPFDPELYLDRSKLWIEARMDNPDRPEVRLRYTRTERDGRKASTAWGTTSDTGAARYLAPSFRDIDEVSHEVLLDAIFKPEDDIRYSAGVRWLKTDSNGRLQQNNNPGAGNESFLTHREDFKNDMFSMHGTAERQVSEQLRLTTGASWTTLSGTVSMDRISGNQYNPVFGPGSSGTHQINLHGRNDLKQFVGTLNALYVPAENLTIVPSVRFEKTYRDQFNQWDSASTTSVTPNEIFTSRDYNLITASLQSRYTGIRNVTLTAGLTGSTGSGNLDEQFYTLANPNAPVLSIDNANKDSRKLVQADAGAHWRINRTVRVSVNARHKRSTSSWDVIRDNTPNASGGNRYPLYISEQEIQTNSVNARLTWRVNPRVTSISRVDWLATKVDSQSFATPTIQSLDHERVMLSQGISFLPADQLTIQASVNVVSDLFTTPVVTGPGEPRNGLVTKSDQGYAYGQVSAFWYMTDATNLTVTYMGLFIDGYDNNAPVGLPLGQQLNEHTTTARLSHRFTENLLVSLDYMFQHSRTIVTGGNTNYTAHVVGTRLQYRF